MMLPKEKTKPKQELKDLSVLLYGREKYGKSSWCSHAEDAVFLATEAGLNSLEVFQVPIDSWETFLTACRELAEGAHSFKTIIVDTIDNAFRLCSQYVCAKHNVEHEADLAYGKGYALVQNEFYRVIHKLSMLPYGLFMVSHAVDREYETRTGKYVKTVPTLPDKLRKVILGMVDMILFCDIEAEKAPDGKPLARRVIRTKPSRDYDAGDRTGRLPAVIDLDYDAFLAAFQGSKPSEKAGPETKTRKENGK